MLDKQGLVGKKTYHDLSDLRVKLDERLLEHLEAVS